jgi:glycosyltransferase involved in cell wall biosynthesis
MRELADVFTQANIPDTTLVLTGYDNRFGIMPEETEFVKPLLLDSRDDVLSAISEADLYILHSYSEGFGLVLLESMYNNTQWAARRIAGAASMTEFGFTYTKDEELIEYMRAFQPNDVLKKKAYDYVTGNRLIKNTVDDILEVLQ